MTQVTMYGSPSCGPCMMQKSILDSLRVSYDYIDCSASPEIAQKEGVTTVPVLKFPDGDTYTGLTPAKIIKEKTN